jgi:glutamate carboxypeptidase
MIPINDLHSWLRKRETETLRLLRHMVEIETPTHDKAAVDRLGQIIAREWKRRSTSVRILRQKNSGNHVLVELRPRNSAGAQLLVLGHLDTVYPIGTLAKMPFRVSNGQAWGPGTFDMKGGLTIALAAIDALRALTISPRRKVVFLWTSDEETGSKSSRMFIEREARKSKAVFVLEPAYGPSGYLKTKRKGVGEAQLIVTGRSAHAGIDPESGINAVHELALQITRLLKWNDRKRGITVQANVIEGGTASNAVAASARALIDVRATRLADARSLNRKFQALRPILPGAKLEVLGGINRPPMEQTPGSRALFAHAQELAREMRLQLGEAATGGGSDGNFTSALGIPTLDGLGAVGDGAHSPREHILVSSLSERAALLAGLLATV